MTDFQAWIAATVLFVVFGLLALWTDWRDRW